jgi:hypothetical protein
MAEIGRVVHSGEGQNAVWMLDKPADNDEGKEEDSPTNDDTPSPARNETTNRPTPALEKRFIHNKRRKKTKNYL